MNIAHWLFAQAQRNPNNPALLIGDTLIADYQQFASAASKVGEILQKKYQCQPGDRVVLYSQNKLEYLVVMYAVWWIGCIATPINYRLHAKEVEWILHDTEAKVVFTSNGELESQIKFPSSCQEYALDNLDLLSLINNDECMFSPPKELDSEELAWLFYTSGTTGRPKGVMLTHANLIAMSLCYPVDVNPISKQDSIYYAAPISHGAGLYNFIFTRTGAKHIVPRSGGFNEEELIENAKNIKNLCFFAAPTILKRLVERAKELGYRGEGIKTIICGGAPLYVADYLEAETQLGSIISQIYGQGECPMTITSMKQEDIKDKSLSNRLAYIQTVGSAQSCVTVRVVDEKMRDLPRGSSGEIIVRGLTVMKGYWKNPEATESTIIDGWLKTGDIGYLNDMGELTLTDRSKDVIISGGSNIYPREVEEVLLHHPKIIEVAVIGEKNENWGEIVTAHIATNMGQPIDEDELKHWCKQSIAGFKIPKKYYFYSELPKSSYGKILKAALRQLT